MKFTKKRTIAYAFGLLLAVTPIWASPELSGTPEELTQYLSQIPSKMMLSASAKDRVALDRISIGIDVKTESSSVAKALDDHDRARRRVIEDLIKKGLTEAQIRTKTFSAMPRPRWIGKIVVVESKFLIDVTSSKELSLIAETIEKNPELKMGEFVQDDSNTSKYERAVLDKALGALQEKVGLYEKRLNVRLVPVTLINEQVYAEGGQPQFRMAKMAMASQDAAGAVEEAMPEPGFGEKTFNAYVTMEFRVLQQQAAK